MNIFTDHPNSVGETYFQHFKTVIKVTLKLQAAVYIQILHAIFPFINPPWGLDVHSLIEYLKSLEPASRQLQNSEKFLKS